MAIRVFQPPQRQIHHGEEKQSCYVITLVRSVGRGAVYLWGRVLTFSPKGVNISSFSFSVRCWGSAVCLPSCGMEAHLGV